MVVTTCGSVITRAHYSWPHLLLQHSQHSLILSRLRRTLHTLLLHAVVLLFSGIPQIFSVRFRRGGFQKSVQWSFNCVRQISLHDQCTVNKVNTLSCEPERHRQPNSNYYWVVMDLMRRAGCGDGRPLIWKSGAGGILTNHFTLGPTLGTAWDTSLSCQEGTQWALTLQRGGRRMLLPAEASH